MGPRTHPSAETSLARPDTFTGCIKAMRRINWVVYAKRPFGGPAQVLAYLGRYTHRVAIANSRLVALDDDQVAFSWKDYRQNSATKDHEAQARRVHPPLPSSHAARWLPSHPPLRLHGQRPSRCQTRPLPRTSQSRADSAKRWRAVACGFGRSDVGQGSRLS